MASGNEALTPRQLMSTADLARNGTLPLTDDTTRNLWSCVDCRGCQSFCDHGNDVPRVLQTMRSTLVRQGHVPTFVQEIIHSFATTGTMPDRPLDDHPANLHLSSSQGALARRAATVLFLGCQGSAQDPGPSLAALALARRHFGDVRVAPPLCCGHPLLRWGATAAHDAHVQALRAGLRGATRIVADDPGCAHMLREVLKINVVSTRSLLRPNDVAGSLTPLRAGRFGVQVLAVRSNSSVSPTELAQVVPHDACFSLRWLYEPSLRTLFPDAPKGSILENQAGCCGGMLLPFYDPELAQTVARQRVEDLLAGGATRIATASPTCRRRLRSVWNDVVDLVEINQSYG